MSLLPFHFVDNIAQLYEFDRIFDFIGDGSFATVYKAVRRSDGFEVALKVVQKSTLTNERSLRDIINEVEILRRLHHENCVSLHDVVQTDSEVFLVLTLCKDSGELFDVVTRSMPHGMPEGLAAVIARQLTSALRYLHVERRVVHRDLKPENVCLSPRQGATEANVHVTLVDFGLAKYLGTTNRLRLHPSFERGGAGPGGAAVGVGSSGGMPPLRSISLESVESADSHSNSPIVATPCGTMKYSAPETLRGLMENGCSPRATTRGSLQKTDMFSVGIIVYILLSGRLPFSGKGKAELAAQMDKGLSFEGRAWAQVSVEAKDFVSKLLHPDPSQRMSADEAVRHSWISVAYPQRTPSVVGLDALDEAAGEAAPQYDAIVTDRRNLNDAFSEMIPADEEGASDECTPHAYPAPGTALRVPPNSLMAPQLLHPPASLRRSTCHTVPFRQQQRLNNYFPFGQGGGSNDHQPVQASEE